MRDEPLPYRQVYRVSDPPAGGDWAFTAPGIATVRIVALRARLVTSAVVATRIPILEMDDGTDVVAASPPGSSTAASLTVDHSAVAGGDSLAVLGSLATWAMPHDGFTLLPGWRVRVSTVALDAGDQWSQVRLLGEVYQTGGIARLNPSDSFNVEPS